MIFRKKNIREKEKIIVNGNSQYDNLFCKFITKGNEMFSIKLIKNTFFR